jgi:hypothetical protein
VHDSLHGSAIQRGKKESSMITKTKQAWEVGEVVKVGFLTLRVTAKEPTPGDYMPDAYLLCGLGDKADRKYRFVPHNGIERLH